MDFLLYIYLIDLPAKLSVQLPHPAPISTSDTKELLWRRYEPLLHWLSCCCCYWYCQVVDQLMSRLLLLLLLPWH